MVNFLSGMFGGGYEKEAAQKDIAAALGAGQFSRVEANQLRKLIRIRRKDHGYRRSIAAYPDDEEPGDRSDGRGESQYRGSQGDKEGSLTVR